MQLDANMTPLDWQRLEILLPVLCVFFVAGVIKGFLGFGLPSASVASLTPLVGLPMAVGLILFPTIAANAWQGLLGGALLTVVVRFWPLLVPAVIGTWVGAGILAHSNFRQLHCLLGMSLCAYALASLRTTPRRSRRG